MLHRLRFQISLANWLKLCAMCGVMLAVPSVWVRWHHQRLFEHRQVDRFVSVANTAFLGFPHRDYAVYVVESTIRSGGLDAEDLHLNLEVLRRLGTSDQGMGLLKQIVVSDSSVGVPTPAIQMLTDSTDENREYLYQLASDPNLRIADRICIVQSLDQCRRTSDDLRRRIVELTKDLLIDPENDMLTRLEALSCLSGLRSRNRYEGRDVWRSLLHVSLLENDPVNDEAYACWKRMLPEFDHETRSLIAQRCQGLLNNSLTKHSEQRLLESLLELDPVATIGPAAKRYRKRAEASSFYRQRFGTPDWFVAELPFVILQAARNQQLQDRKNVRMVLRTLLEHESVDLVLKQLRNYRCLNRDLWLELLQENVVPSDPGFARPMYRADNFVTAGDLLKLFDYPLPEHSATAIALSDSSQTVRNVAERQLGLRMQLFQMIDDCKLVIEAELRHELLKGRAFLLAHGRLDHIRGMQSEPCKDQALVDFVQASYRQIALAEILKKKGPLESIPRYQIKRLEPNAMALDLQQKAIQLTLFKFYQITRILTLNPAYNGTQPGVNQPKPFPQTSGTALEWQCY